MLVIAARLAASLRALHDKVLWNGRTPGEAPSAGAVPAPARVAVIMDGNGRWAARRGLPRTAGHAAGAGAAERVVESCARRGVRELTLFAFSTENWRRPPAEVAALMDLLARWAGAQRARLVDGGVRFRALGRLDRLPPHARDALQALAEATAGGARMTLRVALDHGGRAEIVEAARRLAREAAADPARLASLDALDEAGFARLLPDPDMGDPDLVIRTGGESRLSNFLLWRLAYTEIHVTERLWPDFADADLERAFFDFSRRERRMGGVPQK